ncbi:hypothetical protein QZH41_006020 [Actinostola sp. cb2023]|nr:hypothetical protein QZH41_006020 [Actinostola sp. cb2023]
MNRCVYNKKIHELLDGKATYQKITVKRKNPTTSTYRCGKEHAQRDICPASGKTCYKCNKKGHFSHMCRTPTDIHECHGDSSDSDEQNGVTCDHIEESEAIVNMQAPRVLDAILNKDTLFLFTVSLSFHPGISTRLRAIQTKVKHYMVSEVSKNRLAMTNNEKQIPSLDVDHGNIAENWNRWKELILLVFEAPHASKWQDSEKAAYLLISIGQKGRDICRAWCSSNVLSAEEKQNHEKLIEMFEAYCIPRKSTTIQRKLFYETNQGEKESLEEWITHLRLIAKYCSFHDCDDMIKDRIVIGTNSKEIQEKLLIEDDLTLEKAIKISQAYETSKAQMKEISNANEPQIHMVKGLRAKPKGTQAAQRKGKRDAKHTPQGKDSCSRCGKEHAQRDICPASGKTCYKCNKKGHFSHMCRTPTDIHECHGDSSRKER